MFQMILSFETCRVDIKIVEYIYINKGVHLVGFVYITCHEYFTCAISVPYVSHYAVSEISFSTTSNYSVIRIVVYIECMSE